MRFEITDTNTVELYATSFDSSVKLDRNLLKRWENSFVEVEKTPAGIIIKFTPKEMK